MIDLEAAEALVDVELEGADALIGELDVERRVAVLVARVEGDRRLDVVRVVGALDLDVVEGEEIVERIAARRGVRVRGGVGVGGRRGRGRLA